MTKIKISISEVQKFDLRFSKVNCLFPFRNLFWYHQSILSPQEPSKWWGSQAGLESIQGILYSELGNLTPHKPCAVNLIPILYEEIKAQKSKMEAFSKHI